MSSSATRTALFTDDGKVAATYVVDERDGDPCADLVHRELEIPDLLDLMLERWAGWQVAADPELGQALLQRGATTVRHAHTLTVDTAQAPDSWRDITVSPDLRIEPVDVTTLSPLALLPSQEAAYPSSHPDHETDRGTLLGLLDLVMGGDVVGPLLDESSLVLDGDDVVAGLLVNQRPGEAPVGGPWVADVWRHPDYRGLGTILLQRAIVSLRDRGVPHLTLTVTEGNPARTRYEALGFQHRVEALRVRLPEKPAERSD